MPKRILQGVVVSDACDKTIIVRVERRARLFEPFVLRRPGQPDELREAHRHHRDRAVAQDDDMLQMRQALRFQGVKRAQPQCSLASRKESHGQVAAVRRQAHTIERGLLRKRNGEPQGLRLEGPLP